jgi:hypothetical protein
VRGGHEAASFLGCSQALHLDLVKRPASPEFFSDLLGAAELKAQTHLLEDGTPAHSFPTLLQKLSITVRNRCTVQGSSAPFDLLSTFNLAQRRALDLVANIEVSSELCSLYYTNLLENIEFSLQCRR